MAKNYGKNFEAIIGKAFEVIPGVSVDRIPDQTMHYKGRRNVSDFIIYKKPYQFYIECKTVHGNSLPFANISQFDALMEKDIIPGVRAGIICWWVDKDVTLWLPIWWLNSLRDAGIKSIRYDTEFTAPIRITGKKKKIYFEYDLSTFFEHFR